MNDIVRRLPSESRTRLLADATRVAIRKDQVLCDDAADLSWAYLPCSGLVSLQALTEDGSSIEIAMVGRDGLIGFFPEMSMPGQTYRAVVSIPGDALRLRKEALLSEFGRVAAARQVLWVHWSLFVAEIARNCACYRFHPARQRFARWLLAASDRTGLTRFQFTQDDLAPLLGLHRSRVSPPSLSLQDSGAIRARHGRIIVLDRARLERAACECYRLASCATGPASGPDRSAPNRCPDVSSSARRRA